MKMAGDQDPKSAQVLIANALRTIEFEVGGLSSLAHSLRGGMAGAFCAAVGVICQASGRVIVTGIGKSGHIATKIAATLASTGTPASFVHAGEARHGDLGMITANDVILALSWSGETSELRDVIDYAARFSVPLIAMTGDSESTLGKAADIKLTLPGIEEACPYGLAPTTSTTMQLVLGDALAVSLLEARGFTASQFKTLHPGGRLGAQLTFVYDIMHAGDEMPLVPSLMPMSEALIVMTAKRLGCLGIIGDDGRLEGIITDGDLRRKMVPDFLTQKVSAIMTPDAKCIPPDTLASQAVELLNAYQITTLFVVDGGRPIGVVHIHDLLRIGVV